MDRKELEFYIAQSIHGELSPKEEAKLGQILKQSSEARELYEEMKKLWDLLDVWEAPEPPVNLSQRFSARLAEQSQPPPSVLKKIERPYNRRIQRRWSWNLAGLALAATLALGVFQVFNHKIALPPPNEGSAWIVTQETPLPPYENLENGTFNKIRSRPTPKSVEAGSATTPVRTALEYNRLPETGVFVERLPQNPSTSREANFAVHNFSANIPEINTQHYNTVLATYENPL